MVNHWSFSPKLPPKQVHPNRFLFLLELPLWSYASVLFFASLLRTGYAVYFENHAIQIPLVHLLQDSSLYPGDPFAATLSGYSSMLWYWVAQVAQIVPLESLLLALFLMERLFVIGSAGYLAQTFAPNSKLAIVGAIGLMGFIQPLVGHGTIITKYFEQTGLAVPFLLLAIALFYRARPALCAICLAIGFNLNSMYGVYAFTYLGVVFLLDATYRRAWKRWLRGLGLFALLALPAIFFTLSAFSRKATDAELWLAACRLFSPFHFYPHTWTLSEVSRLAVLLIGFVAFTWQHRQEMEKLAKHSLIWTGVCLGWLVYAFVAAYIVQSPSMLVMHPVRGTDLWYCLAGISLISICAVKLEAAQSRTGQIGATIILLVTVLWGAPRPIVLAGVLLVVALRFVRSVLDRGSSRHLALLVTVIILLNSAISFQSRWLQSKSFEAAMVQRPSTALTEVADWAEVHTALDATFLVDPSFRSEFQQFRGLAKRPVFLTWRDGAAILWNQTYAQAWSERLAALGLDITEAGLNHQEATDQIGRLYEQLQDKQVTQLMQRFSIRYWVVPVAKNSNFSPVFQNRLYKVLALN